MLHPQLTIWRTAIAGGAKVDGELTGFGSGAEGPVLQLGHVDERERGLHLIGATAGAGVIGGVENAVGGDEVGGATAAKATPVAGATVVGEVIKPRRAGAKGKQVFAANGSVTAVVALVFPAGGLAGLDVNREAAVAVGDDLILH